MTNSIKTTHGWSIVAKDDATGLIRLRTALPISRRTLGKGLLGAGVAATFGLSGGSAQAATEVNYMGWQGYDEGLDVDNWLAKNEIVLKTTYIAANEEILATAQAGGIGNMDITSPVASYVPFYNYLDLVEPLDLDRIPNFKNLFPRFRDMETIRDDAGNVYALPFVWGSVPLMYNAEVVTETPTSWFDMMQDKYKGKVALSEDLVSIMTAFTYAATGTDTPTRITKEQLDDTIDLIIKLKKEYLRTITASYGELASLLASGDVIMCPGWEPISVWAGPDAPEIKWVMPKEGSLVFVDVLSMMRKAPHVDINYEILNHSLSVEAQTNTAEINLTAVTVEAAVPMLSETPRTIYPYDDMDSYFERAGGLQPFWPIEPLGDYVTYDEVQEAWERFLAA